MIIKRNGKYFREKLVEEEISATDALEERIAELEDEIAELKEQMTPLEPPFVIPYPYPLYPERYFPSDPNSPIWKISWNDVTC